MKRYMSILCCIAGLAGAAAPAVDEAALRKAVTLYASFDVEVKADVGGGDLSLWTRAAEDPAKKEYVYEKGFDAKVLKIVKGKGVAGGCLDATDTLPKNGRVYFPAKGNLAFKKGGWGGAVSVWINTDPNTLIKSKFCDPIQITQKGANNGGIWFDVNDAKPRDLRMGVFPAVPEGGVAVKEEDPKAPMVRVPKVDFKRGDWHHVVLNWSNLDTGKKLNARMYRCPNPRSKVIWSSCRTAITSAGLSRCSTRTRATRAGRRRRTSSWCSARYRRTCQRGRRYPGIGTAKLKLYTERLLPQPRDRIGIESRIRAKNRHPFRDGLGDQKSVKRVPMVKVQARQEFRMARFNRQYLKMIVENRFLNERRKGNEQLILVRANFNSHFPVINRTSEYLTDWIGDE